MKILVIEDNRLIAAALRRGLKTSYRVELAATGRAGLDRAQTAGYNLILLDLSLPDISGQEICQALRRQGIRTPILVLTGTAAISEKVKLLDMGADDYITKPFNLGEVQARIRAALRRTTARPAPAKLSVPGLELDPASHSVRRHGRPVELRRKEFDILEYLLRNYGKTVTRAMIVSHIWEVQGALWANVVDVHIKHLRDQIDRPYGSNLIKTVHGVGYKLESAEGRERLRGQTM